jgi:integrase/recombinase XerD
VSLRTHCVIPAPCHCYRPGLDLPTIALWLGHEQITTVQIYLHADLALKERALARTSPPEIEGARRYRAPDSLLAFLEGL